jgi:hypothetical protein
LTDQDEIKTDPSIELDPLWVGRLESKIDFIIQLVSSHEKRLATIESQVLSLMGRMEKIEGSNVAAE